MTLPAIIAIPDLKAKGAHKNSHHSKDFKFESKWQREI